MLKVSSLTYLIMFTPLLMADNAFDESYQAGLAASEEYQAQLQNTLEHTNPSNIIPDFDPNNPASSLH